MSVRSGSGRGRLEATTPRSGSGGGGRSQTPPAVETTEAEKKQALVEELALLGDVTEDEEIFHLFQMVAVPPTYSVVDIDSARRILEAIGIVVDETHFESVIGDQEDLTYDQVKDVASQLRALQGMRDDNETQQERETEIVSLGVGQYLWKRITCQSPPPGVEYRLAGPKVELKPRHILISSMAFITLLCCGLMVLSVALLWTEYANSINEKRIRVLGETSQRFLLFFENVMMSANGEELRRTSMLIAAYGDAGYYHEAEHTRTKLVRRARHVAKALDARGNATLLSTQRSITNSVRLLKVMPTRFLSRSVASQRTAVAGAAAFDLASAQTVSGSALVCNSRECAAEVGCLDAAVASQSALGQYSTSAYGTITATGDVTAAGGHTVCAFYWDMAARSAVATQLVQGAMPLLGTGKPWSSVMRVAFANDPVEYHPPETAVSVCAPGNAACAGQDGVIEAAFRTRKPASAYVTNHGGADTITAAAPSRFDGVAMTSTTLAALHDDFTNRQYRPNIENLNYIRAVVLGSTIEVVYMHRNTTTGEIIQASEPALGGCLGICNRPPPGFDNARDGFENRGMGWSITPDYRPEPIIGGFAYDPEGTVDVVIVVERDVPEVRRIAMESMVQLLTLINAGARQTTELMLVHPKGELLTETYDPSAACPVDVSCVTYDVYGVVYRSDCEHCTRHVTAAERRLEFLFPPKLQYDCANRGRNCSFERLETATATLSWDAMNRQDRENFVSLRETDYRGVEVIAFVGYVANFSASLVVKQDRSDVFDDIINAILISTGACAGIIIVITCAYVLLARSLLTKIEEEWMQYKQLISRERQAFSDSVKEMMPAYMAERITRNEVIQGEHSNVCVAFVDLKGSSRRSDEFDPPQLARFLTYIFHVTDAYGSLHNVHRVRFVGDTSIFVSGLNESTGESSNQQHYTVRMMCFLTNIVQVSGARYAHYPHRCDLIANTFGPDAYNMPDIVGEPQHVGCINMPPLSIGVNQGGVTVSLLFFENGAPLFDVLGSNVSLAHRLCQTAREGTVLVSDSVKDSIERYAPDGMFTFGKTRKIVIRGRGTASSNNVKVARVALPSSPFTALGIRYSRLRKHFDQSDEQVAARRGDRSSSASMSQSDVVSQRSGRSSISRSGAL